MTLPPDKIDDKGQRFLVEAKGYPKSGQWCGVGYVHTMKDAWQTAAIISINPGVTQVRVTDRHVRGTPEDKPLPDEYPLKLKEIIYPIKIRDQNGTGLGPDEIADKIIQAMRSHSAIVAWCWPSSTFDTVKRVTFLGLRPLAISDVHGKGYLVLYTKTDVPSAEAWEAWSVIAAGQEIAGNASNWFGWPEIYPANPKWWEQ